MFYIKEWKKGGSEREGWGEFLVADVSWLGLWYWGLVSMRAFLWGKGFRGFCGAPRPHVVMWATRNRQSVGWRADRRRNRANDRHCCPGFELWVEISFTEGLRSRGFCTARAPLSTLGLCMRRCLSLELR